MKRSNIIIFIAIQEFLCISQCLLRSDLQTVNFSLQFYNLLCSPLTAQKYFLALEEGINTLPGFAPEIQGVYLQKDPDGRTRAYGYVLTDY